MGSSVGVAGWIALYVVIVIAPVLALAIGPAPMSQGFWHEAAIGLGFVGVTMAAMQFVLTGRLKRPEAPVGIDVLYYLHRYLGLAALAVVIGHAVVMLAWRPGLLRVLDPRTAPWSMTAGTLSALGFVLLVVSSLLRRRLGLEYDAWRVTHVVLALGAMGLAVAHVEGIGSYVAAPGLRIVWTAIVVAVAALVVRVRLVRPWQLARRPFEVTRVGREPGDAWTLSFAPHGHAGLAFRPGQFVWLTLRSSPFAMREHPFSVSSAPDPSGGFELTVKELGDFTRTIGGVTPGETAFVDGPYGTFVLDRGSIRGACFIGGGIGLAPIMSILRALAGDGDRRPLLAIAASSAPDRAIFHDALHALAPALPQLQIVEVFERAAGTDGDPGRVDAALLDRHLPADRRELEYFVCGPPAMIEATEQALAALGIPAERCHSELFDLV
jgi:predicted ferric reductase